MKLYCPAILIVAILLSAKNNKVLAQDSTDIVSRITGFPSRFISKINKKTMSLDARLTRQTEKYLNKLSRSENKLKKKLSRVDSVASRDLFSFDATAKYRLLL